MYIHVTCINISFIHFYGQIVFHVMDIPHFVFSPVSRWTFRLFLVFGYYKYQYMWFCVDVSFQFSWVDTQEQNCWVYGNSIFNPEKLPNCFPKWLHHFTFSLKMYERSNFSISLPTLVIVVCLIIAILVGVKWCLIVVLIGIFLVANDVEHHFIFLAICLSSLEKSLFQSLLSIFKIALSFYY